MTARVKALALAALAALGSWVLYVYPPAGARWYPRCPIFVLTGWKCAGCGELRAMHALLHGRIAEAAGYNGLFIVLLPAAVGFAAWQIYSAVRWGRFRTAPWLTPALGVAGGAAVVFGILRNVA